MPRRPMMGEATRRMVLASGLIGLAAPAALARGGEPPGGRLIFEIWRQGRHIGRHTIVFSDDPAGTMVAAIDADIAVKLGPIPVFRYRHEAEERWRGGRFVGLTSRTLTNGRREQVAAARQGGALVVTTMTGVHRLAESTLPLTHWNAAALAGPLFNPQTGAPMRERAARGGVESVRLADGRNVQALRYTLTGEADIIDWYAAGQVWTALRAKARDGSFVEYRRSA